jgi:glycosyltransferase involved in cell wall biosynthesis
MIFGPAVTSRAEATRIVAAELGKPVTWTSLTQLARDLATQLPKLDAAPVEPPPALRPRLVAALPEPAPETLPARTGIRAMLLLLDVAALGVAEGLARTVDEVSLLPDAAGIFSGLARLLDAASLGRDLTAGDLERICRRLPGDRIDVLLAGFAVLGLSRAAPYPARRNAFHHVAAPWLRALADRGQADAMLVIESYLYDAYLKTVETPAHHTETLRVIEAAFAGIAAEPRPPRPAPPHDRPRLAFMIFNGGVLAHTEVLLSFLSGLGKLEAPPIEPLVFIYGAAEGGELGHRLDGLGVPWQAMGRTDPRGYETHYRRVRERLAEAGVDGAVFVSLPLHLAYFCRRPLAPVQIWWSMKFPLPNFAELDGRVFYRSLLDRKVVIEGRTWRGGPLAVTPPPRPAPQAVQAIRARFPGKTILGTIAREEKIAEPTFLAAVAEVLQRHPDACFLWTGRTQLPEVQTVFDRARVADRCHFVGWVDPAPYIMAFDLFLETYPLTGIMCAWAMAFGQPLVSVGPLGFLGTYLEPILTGAVAAEPEDLERIETVFAPIRGRLPGLWARNPSEMGAFVDALIADPELRRTLGRVQQAYVETFLGDEAASAAAQAGHFADIVREVFAAVSAGTRAPPR